jgi:hypothetical protein
MKIKTFTAIAVALVLVLLVSASALAMTSPNFLLNWFTPLTGSGGGRSTSPSYSANITIGQVAIGLSSSTNYRTGLGYWPGAGNPYNIFVPMLKKN